jgi:hypothetical protein
MTVQLALKMPLPKGRNKPGEGHAAKWIFEHAAHKGEDCLYWPFGTASHGYGSLGYNSKNYTAPAFMCETAYGPRGEGQVVRHLCGRKACVNPKHLTWGTPHENMQDRVRHDAHKRGERQWTAKLTETDVRAIREMRGTISSYKIAALYGVARGTIADILHRRTWAWM